MKTTKEMIEVMRAYDEGEKIEAIKYGYRDSTWFVCEPDWNWFDYDYRVKKDHLQKTEVEKENAKEDD